MTYFILAAMAALTLILLATQGAQKALWIIWPLGFLLMPSWAAIPSFGGLPFSSQLMPLLLLPALLMGPSRDNKTSATKWCLADTLMLLMFICQNISEMVNGTYSIMTTPGIFMLWGAPYIFGRLYLRSEKDLDWALWPFALCITALCSLIVLEAVTGINLFRAVMGMNQNAEVRVGLHRASGAMNHPIYQGVVLVFMAPLAIEAAARARAHPRRGPAWWRRLPWVLFAAVIGTVSRGPMAAAIGTMAIYLFFRRPALRLPLACVGVIGAALMVLAPDTVKSGLFAISGEDKFLEENERTIVIDGEEFQYSGTDHRWMLYHAYRKPLANAGLFGYGYGRKTELIEEDFQQFNKYFYSIDNNTINHILTYGYLGLTFFLLLPVVALAYLAAAAWRQNSSLARLAAGMFGSLLTVNLALFSVGMTRGYVMIWPFATALAVSVAQLARASSRAPATAPGRQTPTTTYLPWYPPSAPPPPPLQPGLMPHSNKGHAGWNPG